MKVKDEILQNSDASVRGLRRVPQNMVVYEIELKLVASEGRFDQNTKVQPTATMETEKSRTVTIRTLGLTATACLGCTSRLDYS